MTVTAEAWILNQKDHVEALRSKPYLRDHMLAHGLDPDPDKIGITIGDIDLETLNFMHDYDHEAMCACGRKLVVAEVQDLHQKASGRLTMVCSQSYVAPERCKASRTKVAAYHGY